MVYLTELADVLRGAGLNVYEVDGWKARGRPTGSFNPVGILWHHTGSYDSLTDAQNDIDYAKWLALTGRTDLPAPLCQLSISAEGTVFVCAAGRSNHAGTAKAAGPVPAGDGNTLYLGVECMNSGKQGWPRPQYDAMVTVGAVLGRDVIACPPSAQRAHKETSVTGKWDPGMLDMDKFRSDIANAMEDDMPLSDEDIAKVADAVTSRLLNADVRVSEDEKKGKAPLKLVLRWILNDGRRTLSRLPKGDAPEEPTPPGKA